MRSKHKQNWINYLERLDNTRLPKHAPTTNLEEEEIVGAIVNYGDASMPEQVKRPNTWKKKKKKKKKKKMMMMMMMILVTVVTKPQKLS